MMPIMQQLTIENSSFPGNGNAQHLMDAFWLYHVFSPSLRDVELLLAEWGVAVSYEAVRRSCKKFGWSFTSRLKGDLGPAFCAFGPTVRIISEHCAHFRIHSVQTEGRSNGSRAQWRPQI
jgi:hypothetical protein